MPTTHHDTKEDLVEELWRQLIEAGADERLVAQVVSFVGLRPEQNTPEAHDAAIDQIIELAWKCGALDMLGAIELGAVHGFFLKQTQGDN